MASASGMLNVVFASLEGINHGLETQAISIVRENDNILIDMNLEQLYAGLNSKGQSLESIGGPYSPSTIQIKMAKGQPIDRVTLRDEGDFYEAFFVDDIPGGWSISSNDWKTSELIADWGADIFGNTEADEEEFNMEYLLPGLVEWILSNIKL